MLQRSARRGARWLRVGVGVGIGVGVGGVGAALLFPDRFPVTSGVIAMVKEDGWGGVELQLALMAAKALQDTVEERNEGRELRNRLIPVLVTNLGFMGSDRRRRRMEEEVVRLLNAVIEEEGSTKVMEGILENGSALRGFVGLCAHGGEESMWLKMLEEAIVEGGEGFEWKVGKGREWRRVLEEKEVENLGGRSARVVGVVLGRWAGESGGEGLDGKSDRDKVVSRLVRLLEQGREDGGERVWKVVKKVVESVRNVGGIGVEKEVGGWALEAAIGGFGDVAEECLHCFATMVEKGGDVGVEEVKNVVEVGKLIVSNKCEKLEASGSIQQALTSLANVCKERVGENGMWLELFEVCQQIANTSSTPSVPLWQMLVQHPRRGRPQREGSQTAWVKKILTHASSITKSTTPVPDTKSCLKLVKQLNALIRDTPFAQAALDAGGADALATILSNLANSRKDVSSTYPQRNLLAQHTLRALATLVLSHPTQLNPLLKPLIPSILEMASTCSGLNVRTQALRLLHNASVLPTASTSTSKYAVEDSKFEDGVLPVVDLTMEGSDDDRTPIDIVLVHGLQGGALRTFRSHPLGAIELDRDVSGIGGLEGFGRCDPSMLQMVLYDQDDATRVVWPASWLAPFLHKRGIAARVVAVQYEADTSVSSTNPLPPQSIREAGAWMEQALSKAKIGTNGRPVLFLTHSMGGLVTKAALTKAQTSSSTTTSLLKSRTAVVFMGTPHFGTPLASWTAGTIESTVPESFFKVSPAVSTLKDAHPELLTLNNEFRKLCVRGSGTLGVPMTDPGQRTVVLKEDEDEEKDGKPSITSSTPLPTPRLPEVMSGRVVRCLSLWEALSDDVGLPLKQKVRIVPATSADPGFGDYVIIEDADHLHVCKPESIKDIRFQLAAHAATTLATREEW